MVEKQTLYLYAETMHLISIPIQDSTLANVTQRAVAEGFSSPAAFLSHWFERNFNTPLVNMDAFFTPAILQDIHEAAIEADSQPSFTPDQVRQEIKELSAAWQTHNAN
jgi:hypothetical protein